MPTAKLICIPCRIKLASAFLARRGQSPLSYAASLHTLRAARSITATTHPRKHVKKESRTLHSGLVRVFPSSPKEFETEPANDDHEGARLREVERQRELDPELAARAARRYFGERLPHGVLSHDEQKIYERLYGPPLGAEQPLSPQASKVDEESTHVLLREDESGNLQTVQEPGDAEQDLFEYDELEEDPMADAGGAPSTRADMQLQQDIAMSLQHFKDQAMEVSIQSPDETGILETRESPEDDLDEQDTVPKIRTHPFTLASRFGTSPSTVPLPHAAMTGPTSLLLSNLSNKHLDEAAHRLFGGPGLPYSPATPITSRTMPQKPIPLPASQGRLTEMEADVYMAAIMPGTYASILSVLVELRRRLGTQWIEGLMRKEGGPRILDAGAAGAGVLAWREILKAEWLRMHATAVQDAEPLDPSNTSAVSDRPPPSEMPSIPLGKATVLTGSTALRHRASLLLENTTFLPRLPDYVPTRLPSEDTKRKQYDIIVAPHSLWHLAENWERREKILNLWSLLNPNGGIIVYLEKGVPHGFEVIAETRSYMLKTLFERQDATEDLTQPASHATNKLTRRAPARIVAPCPGHAKCPMYQDAGAAKQRKDYCHFSQRFVRPAYYQRMLGAKRRNHEDVEFSYIAVQKGVADPPSTAPHAVSTGKDATDRAFAGYDLANADLVSSRNVDAGSSAPAPALATAPVTPDLPRQIPHRIPRIVLPPLKRKGHVHLDVCLPSGALERWTVPRSFSRLAYRDARKAHWGDLWALGAKQRENRRLRVGKGDMAEEGGELNGGQGRKPGGKRDVVRRGSLEDPVLPRRKMAGKKAPSKAKARRMDKKKIPEQLVHVSEEDFE